ncbi:PEP-CTERM sorting domain-containing protein [Psychromonas arctica]|uniref:PEP-CTERM sorting domain-containing protein n=1 Tax=Psychromonas arctica TaxID=168275 RepID=UPI0003FC667C|nr:PEP-CTERM sorting domain-containing protein [Psychromonas arctica]
MRKIISILVPLLFSVAAQATVISTNSIGYAGFSKNDNLIISSAHGDSKKNVANFTAIDKSAFNSLTTGSAKSGSAYQNTVAVDAGSTFSFDWKWWSDEVSNIRYNDFAFVNLSLGSLDWLADTSTPDYTTGNFAWTAAESGWLTYTIGVFNVGDTFKNSTLIVKNISVSNPASVPSPASLGILAVALVGLIASRRRKQV